jgi:hypothetical protein
MYKKTASPTTVKKIARFGQNCISPFHIPYIPYVFRYIPYTTVFCIYKGIFTLQILIIMAGGGHNVFGQACLMFGINPPDPPPTPYPPLSVPPPRRKGYQSAPVSNRHPSAYLSRPETEVLQGYGAKTEIRMPMHT